MQLNTAIYTCGDRDARSDRMGLHVSQHLISHDILLSILICHDIAEHEFKMM